MQRSQASLFLLLS
ncbi:hypothetical protein E2C01_094657 [Portunus trituberculatus]|uniref:Uncharacterized protein n=1 Tax=Portunus trituberculatus TaxID=210409 RepID=A0A5B7JY87_PORTR|nr:hypothetical protein [Portunus trituberculatus]